MSETDMEGRSVEIKVLGPIEVWDGERPVHLARRQQRLILGILALEPNRLIPSDRLIDLLWGEHPPPTARAVLQSRISELRSKLSICPTTRLSVGGAGYTLHFEPERIDAHRFRRLVDDARREVSDERARHLLREGLGLWRGPVLGGALPESSHHALSEALNALRLTAMEDLFAVELRCRNHYDIVDEIVAASATNPTRERLLEHAMLALQRTGRGAEALQRYDRWRRWLRDELGVSPGEQLEKLYLALLDGTTDSEALTETPLHLAVDTTNPGRAALPHMLPPGVPDFTGRAHEIAMLRDILATPSKTSVPIVAIAGPGGVGKTTLSTHIAQILREEFPEGHLFVNLHGIAEDEPVTPFAALGRFLNALGIDGAAMPNTEEERTDLYRELLYDRRILVVLDNAANDDQVLPLIPGGCRAAVIINGRARLGTTIGGYTLDLAVLEPPEAMNLISRIIGDDRLVAEPSAAKELSRQCGYLPLALRIAGAKLRAKPHWRVRKLVDLLQNELQRLDQFVNGRLDVRASISLSYSGMDCTAQQLLRRIGDLGLHEVTVWLCTALLDSDPEVTENVLERLFDAQLVDIVGRDTGGYPRYGLHDLVRVFSRERALVEESTVDLENSRIRAYGAWLLFAQAAYRAVYGGDQHNIVGSAARWSIDPRFLESLEARPTQWFVAERKAIMTIIRRAADDGRSAECWELACTTSLFFEMDRSFDDWHAILDVALMATRNAGDLRGEGAIWYRFGDLHLDRVEYERAHDCFDKAAALFERESDLRSQVTVAMWAGFMPQRGDNRTQLDRYETLLPLLRELGDLGGEVFALRRIAAFYLGQQLYLEAETHLTQALKICEDNNFPRSEAQTVYWESMLRIRQGRLQEAEVGLRKALDFCRRVGDRPGEAQTLSGLGTCYSRQGDSRNATAVLSQALGMARRSHATLMETVVLRAIAES